MLSRLQGGWGQQGAAQTTVERSCASKTRASEPIEPTGGMRGTLRGFRGGASPVHGVEGPLVREPLAALLLADQVQEPAVVGGRMERYAVGLVHDDAACRQRAAAASGEKWRRRQRRRRPVCHGDFGHMFTTCQGLCSR